MPSGGVVSRHFSCSHAPPPLPRPAFLSRQALFPPPCTCPCTPHSTQRKWAQPANRPFCFGATLAVFSRPSAPSLPPLLAPHALYFITSAVLVLPTSSSLPLHTLLLLYVPASELMMKMKKILSSLPFSQQWNEME